MLRVFFAFVLAAGFGTFASAADKCDGKCNKLTKTSITADKPSVEERFKDMDADNDGKVSLDEFKAFVKKHVKDASKMDKAMEHAEKRFKAIDTNNDGFISLDELKAAPPEKHKKKQAN